MENVIINDIVLNDASINMIKTLQNDNNSELKNNILLIQEVKDFISDIIVSESDNPEKVLELSKNYKKLAKLSDLLECLKK